MFKAQSTSNSIIKFETVNEMQIEAGSFSTTQTILVQINMNTDYL